MSKWKVGCSCDNFKTRVIRWNEMKGIILLTSVYIDCPSGLFCWWKSFLCLNLLWVLRLLKCRKNWEKISAINLTDVNEHSCWKHLIKKRKNSSYFRHLIKQNITSLYMWKNLYSLFVIITNAYLLQQSQVFNLSSEQKKFSIGLKTTLPGTKLCLKHIQTQDLSIHVWLRTRQ